MPKFATHSDDILVSIIIVNWNGAAVLPRCLAALRSQTYQNFELIVVDNGSADRSWEKLEEQWSGLKLIRFSENKGFAAANNEGSRHSSGDWLALLNSDAFPETDWLEKLIDAAIQYPKFSFFGSLLLQADNPELVDGTGDIFHISGLAWRRDYNKSITLASKDSEEIFSPCAAAALFQRDAFLQVGGFDESYFSYHEDVDLGFRLRLRGHRCMYIPEAVVHHLGSATTGKKSDFAVYHGHRNLVWTYVKNMPGWLFWKYLPAHIFANIVFLIYYSFRGQSSAIWRAKWHALLGLPRELQKRKVIQNERLATGEEISRVLEHDWLNPYLNEFHKRGKNPTG